MEDIDLANLSNSQGFRIQGAAANDYTGWSSRSAGDINGDGYDDIIIGAEIASPFARASAGTSYVLFGKASGFVDIDLASLNSTQGFKIHGAAANDRSGQSVSSAEDVNKDGYADIIVGAWHASPFGRTNAGISYVLFGKASGFTDIDLANLSSPQGFKVQGAAANDLSGQSVGSAGDINKDGYADIIVGAQTASPLDRTLAGTSYVIFGKASGFTDIDLANLSSTEGFKIQGAAANDRSGQSVSSAGDINKDGYADIIVGAHNAAPFGRASAGTSYVIFGKASGFIDIDLANLSSSQGFQIQGAAIGDLSGVSVSSAGDVNDDGYGDIIVGAHFASPFGRTKAGTSYVIFGKASGFANIDLASLTSTQGFHIRGANANDLSGNSVSNAGDINRDGYADVIVCAYTASSLGRSGAGISYALFGKASGFADIDLANLSSTQGFKIQGATADDQSGISAGSAGDVNKDGYADIIVGAWYASPFGRTKAGTSYVVFWSTPLNVTAGNAITTYGSIPTLTISYNGFINSEGPSNLITQPKISTSATTTSAPGNYGVKASDGLSYHYDFNYIDGTLTIHKAPLVVTANKATATYGDATLVLTNSYSGFVNLEGPSDLTVQPEVSTTATTLSTPGTYEIRVSGGVSNNYDFKYNTGQLTLKKALLTVTADNATMIYESNLPLFTLHYKGFVNSEDPSDLKVQPIATTTATVISKPGIYPITVSRGASNNYEFKYVKGYLTIYKSSEDNSESSTLSNFIKIGIPIISGVSAAAGLAWTLWQCKKNGAFCFKKGDSMSLALLSQAMQPVNSEQIDEDSEREALTNDYEEAGELQLSVETLISMDY